MMNLNYTPNLEGAFRKVYNVALSDASMCRPVCGALPELE
ncbi:hypothetical protein LMG28690_02524 [Paraburkholderia caffeinilytica]|nr:hypothetical protein LMG28690_02524 [Paraburkholderia caffeinilytica]